MSKKKKVKNKLCPNCGADEFITEPNRYDVMNFNGESFEIISKELIDSFKIYCRECSEEIEEDNIEGIKLVK